MHLLGYISWKGTCSYYGTCSYNGKAIYNILQFKPCKYGNTRESYLHRLEKSSHNFQKLGQILEKLLLQTQVQQFQKYRHMFLIFTCNIHQIRISSLTESNNGHWSRHNSSYFTNKKVHHSDPLWSAYLMKQYQEIKLPCRFQLLKHEFLDNIP